MKLRNKAQSEEKTSLQLRVLRSSSCIDVIKQLPGGTRDMTNWYLGCDFYNSKLQVTPNRKKRKGTNDVRYRCSEPFRKTAVERNITISTIKYNLLCRHINEEPMN